MSEDNVVRICMECGESVDSGTDFCYRCGSRRIIDVNPDTNRVVLEKGQCPFCNNINDPESKFCAKCGNRIGEFQYAGVRRNLTTKDYFILFLAIVPGVFNIFGLGHLCLKQYSRAFMYLIISAVLLYVRWFTEDLTITTLLIVEFFGIIIFMKQAFEVMGAVQRGQGGM